MKNRLESKYDKDYGPSFHSEKEFNQNIKFTTENIWINKFAGSYTLGEGISVGLYKKPKWLHRKLMKLCFGWKWIDEE